MVSSEILENNYAGFEREPPQPVMDLGTKILRLKRHGKNPIPYVPPYNSGVSSQLSLKGSLVSPGIAKLSWNLVPGAVGYKLRRDSQVTDVGNKQETYISNLTNGTSYFDVASYDSSGKLSEFSNVVPLDITGASSPATPTQYITQAADDDLIFGFPSTYVYIGGAVGVAAILYLMSGKK